MARALEAACPNAAPVAPLRVLGEGFFSMAVATASNHVFRLGTAPMVFERYRREWRVLPWLARQRLPLEVPAPRWLLEPGGACPFGGIGYPLIEGRTLTEADATGPYAGHLAEQVAAFNRALHRLPVEEARALGVPDGTEVDRAWHETDRGVSARALAAVLTTEERATIEAWWRGFLEAFEARTDGGYVPVFTHADIGDENLLVALDGTRLLGVIDFEHRAVGEPFNDFRSLVYSGHAFYTAAIGAYERLGGPSFGDLEGYLEWRWQRGAFRPSVAPGSATTPSMPTRCAPACAAIACSEPPTIEAQRPLPRSYALSLGERAG
ncbi:MAG: phosphotransferase [Dehalococcoidia bacterium]